MNKTSITLLANKTIWSPVKYFKCKIFETIESVEGICTNKMCFCDTNVHIKANFENLTFMIDITLVPADVMYLHYEIYKKQIKKKKKKFILNEI